MSAEPTGAGPPPPVTPAAPCARAWSTPRESPRTGARVPTNRRASPHGRAREIHIRALVDPLIYGSDASVRRAPRAWFEPIARVVVPVVRRVVRCAATVLQP